MDEFKQYLKQHADALGNDEPGDRVWQNLQKSLPQKPVKRRYPFAFIGYAAAACLLALAVFGVWYIKHDKATGSTLQPLTKVGPQPIQHGKPVEHAIPERHFKLVKPIAITKSGQHKKRVKDAPVSNNDDLAQLKKVEAGFTLVINMERRKINRTPLLAEDQSYFDYFKKQFVAVNNDEAVLKQQIRQQGFTNDQLSQLIDIYQRKLNILKDLQTEINKTNSLVQQPALKKTSHVTI